MHITIYGKDNCPNCAKSKLLCEMKSVDYDYHTVGTDISLESLHEKVGTLVRTLPQIFLHTDDDTQHVGGYENLRTALD